MDELRRPCGGPVRRAPTVARRAGSASSDGNAAGWPGDGDELRRLGDERDREAEASEREERREQPAFHRPAHAVRHLGRIFPSGWLRPRVDLKPNAKKNGPARAG